MEDLEPISGQLSSVEDLPPVEMATDAAAAAATAGEALLEVKAAEVASMAEVLSRLNEKLAEVGGLADRLESSVSAIEAMKLEIQATLAAIQAQKDAAEAPVEQPQATVRPVRGLGSLLVRRP